MLSGKQHTAQKIKFSIKNFLKKTADLVTFAEEILNGKLKIINGWVVSDGRLRNLKGPTISVSGLIVSRLVLKQWQFALLNWRHAIRESPSWRMTQQCNNLLNNNFRYYLIYLIILSSLFKLFYWRNWRKTYSIQFKLQLKLQHTVYIYIYIHIYIYIYIYNNLNI